MDSLGNIIGQSVGLIGLIVTVLSLGYAYYTNKQLARAVKIGSLRHIRTQINRMEEEKQKQPADSPQRTAMHHTQQELETLFRNLQEMFSISDKDAPRN